MRVQRHAQPDRRRSIRGSRGGSTGRVTETRCSAAGPARRRVAPRQPIPGRRPPDRTHGSGRRDRLFVPVGGPGTRCYAAPAVRTPLLLYGLALAVRVVLIWHFPYPAYPDSSYYVDVARSLQAGHGFNVDFVWIFAEVGGVIPADPTLPDPIERALDAPRLDGPGPVPRGLRRRGLGIRPPVRAHRRRSRPR